MTHRLVYCEIAFLKSFISKLASSSYKEQKANSSIMELLSKAFLVFNVSQKQLIKEFEIGPELEKGSKKDSEKKIFEYLYKRSQECNNTGSHRWLYNDFCDFSPYSTFVPSEKQLLSTYLTTKSEFECNRIMKKWGILALNIEMMMKYSHIFEDCGDALPDIKGIKDGWKSIIGNKYLNVCNSLIVIDNYLLQSDVNERYANKSVNEKIDNNLIPILAEILPKELGVPFHLLIIAREDKLVTFGSLMNEENEEGLCHKIKALRGGKVEIRICLLKSTKEYHDRVIISNNIMVFSGMGFGLFSADNYFVNKPTFISVLFPFLQNHVPWAIKAYDNVIETTKKVFNSQIHYPTDCVRNRILEEDSKKSESKVLPHYTQRSMPYVPCYKKRQSG